MGEALTANQVSSKVGVTRTPQNRQGVTASPQGTLRNSIDSIDYQKQLKG